MSLPPVKSEYELFDNKSAPEIFVDNISGFIAASGVLRITLESTRGIHNSGAVATAERHVVARLAIPMERAEAIGRAILAIVEQTRASAQQAGTKGKRSVQ